MASPNLSEIATVALRSRTGKLADNVTRNNALLARLKERGRKKTFSGGRTIVEEIAYAMNSTYTRYSGYQTIDTSAQDLFSAAEYAIRQSAVAVSISGLEMLQNSGEEAVIDLLDARIGNAEDTFANALSFDIYSDGALSGQIGGLQALVSTAPTSGVVGGIDRATWTFWQNIKFGAVADGGAAMSSANIQSYMNRVAIQLVRGSEGPDLIVADNNAYRYYLESLQAIQRIARPEKTGIGFTSLAYYGSGREIEVVLDGGFQGYSSDTNPTTGGALTSTMYLLNTKYMAYRPHAQRDCVVLDPDRFSVNQDAMVKLIGWAGNLTMRNSRLQGVLTA